MFYDLRCCPGAESPVGCLERSSASSQKGTGAVRQAGYWTALETRMKEWSNVSLRLVLDGVCFKEAASLTQDFRGDQKKFFDPLETCMNSGFQRCRTSCTKSERSIFLLCDDGNPLIAILTVLRVRGSMKFLGINEADLFTVMTVAR